MLLQRRRVIRDNDIRRHSPPADQVHLSLRGSAAEHNPQADKDREASDHVHAFNSIFRAAAIS